MWQKQTYCSSDYLEWYHYWYWTRFSQVDDILCSTQRIKKHVRIRLSLFTLQKHSSHQSVARRDCKDLYRENMWQKLIKWTTEPCKWNKRNRHLKKSIIWEFLVPGSASMACFDFGFRHFFIMVLYGKLTSACKFTGTEFWTLMRRSSRKRIVKPLYALNIYLLVFLKIISSVWRGLERKK